MYKYIIDTAPLYGFYVYRSEQSGGPCDNHPYLGKDGKWHERIKEGFGSYFPSETEARSALSASLAQSELPITIILELIRCCNETDFGKDHSELSRSELTSWITDPSLNGCTISLRELHNINNVDLAVNCLLMAGIGSLMESCYSISGVVSKLE
jgi:hypothetical protein